MGMSSSQARLLSLTGRMHDIEYKAQKLQAQKLQLANESNHVYKNYLNALNANKMQYASIGADGSTTYRDANLRILENGAVSGYDGEVSPKTYLIQDATNGDIYITPEFAAYYNLTEGVVGHPGDLDDWLTAHGCTQQEVMQTVPDYNTVISANPVNNIVSEPGTTTIDVFDRYELNGQLIQPVETSETTPSTYTANGSISVISTEPTFTPITVSYVTWNNIPDSPVELTNTSSVTSNVTNCTLSDSFNTYANATKTYDFAKISDLTGAGLISQAGGSGAFLTISLCESNMTDTMGLQQENNSIAGMQILTSAQNPQTLNSILTNITSTSEAQAAGISYDSSTHILTCPENIHFDTSDKVGKMLESYHTFPQMAAHGKIENNTKIYDYLFSTSRQDDNTAVGFKTDDLIMITKNGEAIDCSYTENTPLEDLTFGEYFQFLADKFGFTYSTNSNNEPQLEINGGNDDYVIIFNEDKYGSHTETTTTNNYELHSKEFAENICFAQFMLSNEEKTLDNYTTYHNNNFNALVNIIKTDEHLPEKAELAAQLNVALSNKDNTQIQSVLDTINNAFNSNDWDGIESGYTNHDNIINNITLNNSNSTFEPSIDIQETGEYNITKGNLYTATNEEMLNYLAYSCYQKDNNKTPNEYLAQIQGQNYNGFQLAELVEYVKANNNDILTALINNEAITLEKYDEDLYDLNQINCGYNVSEVPGTTTNYVTVANRDDILDRLAYDICDKNNTQNFDYVKSQLSNRFSSNQLASLSYYATCDNNSAWNTIVNTLANNLNANVSDYTNKYDGYVITYSSNNAITVTEKYTQATVPTKGEIQIPNLAGIASNLTAAFKMAGKTVDETEVLNKLTAKYGTDNDTNNCTLANINKVVADYLNHSGNINNINNIYNVLYNNGTLSIGSNYNSNDYNFVRANLGTCIVEYGTTPVGTGVYEWNHDDTYYTAIAQYNAQLALMGNNYIIVSDEQASSSEFLNNLVLDNAFILLEFNTDLDNMRETNIAVETNLREVPNTTELKKAEAKYEADMCRINAKDKKYDTDIAALEAERNALKTEVDTLKSVIKENVDKTFKLFG